MKITQIWDRIISKFKEQNLVSDLNPGLNKAQIDHLLKEYNWKLPNDFLQSIQIHDGQVGYKEGILNGWQLLPLTFVISEWELMNKLLQNGKLNTNPSPNDKLVFEWWSKHWIPIASNGAGDLICIDLLPGEKGVLGQIIQFNHATPTRDVLADSFTIWLESGLKNI